MTVRAVHEDGAINDDDPEARSFVGFSTEGRPGVPVARDHDEYLDDRDDR